MARTDLKNDTPVTRGDSRPVRYEIVNRHGDAWTGRQFDSAIEAAKCAKLIWPDQEQDEDRTGKGWDIQIAGCDH